MSWQNITAPLTAVALDQLPGEIAPKNSTAIFIPFSLISDPASVALIIIGQDPYYTPRLATGLAFGIPQDCNKVPPSLKNILAKYGLGDPTLEKWAKKGVLLINSALTVEIGKPNSHSKYWRVPVRKTLQNLVDYSQQKGQRLHFVLWGRKAIELHSQLCTSMSLHTCCCSSHPSPLACRKQVMNYPPFIQHCEIPDCPCKTLYSTAERASETSPSDCCASSNI